MQLPMTRHDEARRKFNSRSESNRPGFQPDTLSFSLSHSSPLSHRYISSSWARSLQWSSYLHLEAIGRKTVRREIREDDHYHPESNVLKEEEEVEVRATNISKVMF